MHVIKNLSSATLFYLFLSGLIPSLSMAQITIAPTTLFLTERSRIANYLVINNSDVAQKVSIDFFFGYVKTDESGNRQIVNESDSLAAFYSLADWLRGFPKTFTLQPGQRQTVRIRTTPPSELEDRTYWARIRTSSNPLTPSIEEQETDILTARISVKIDQVTGIYLKHGDVSTGIRVNDITFNKLDGTLNALVNLDRLGNSPFIGTITASILKNDEILDQEISTTTIFIDGTYAYSFDLNELESGSYDFSITFKTERPDIRKEELVQGKTETATKGFILE